ncbi:MAG: alpha/beta hydrolase [Pseudomonadota bacterium]
MASIKVNGITLAYQADGDPAAPPVLLIMGLGMQLTSWPERLVEGLVEQGLYVIRFDNRDSGLSTKLDSAGAPNLALAYLKHLVGWRLRPAYTLHDMAADAAGLLRALGVGPAHVIGVSMGGMIGQVFAARYPKLTASLTSIMSSSGRRGLPGPSKAARRALMGGPRQRADPEQAIAYMARTFRVIGSPAYPTPDKVLRQRIEASLRRGGSAGGTARQMVAVVASGDRSALLGTLRCPVLVIHGAADPLVPLACGIDTARQIPQAALHVIEGMGHDLPDQLIERLLALIEAHLHGNMASPSRSRMASTGAAGLDRSS